MAHRKGNGMNYLFLSVVWFGLLCMTLRVSGQSSAKDGEWPTYGADLASTRYRPFDQIDASNFNKLELAWSFKTDSLGTRPEYKLEGTPLMINAVLYTTAGTRRSVVALDAATGELLWVHGEHEGARGAARDAHRGNGSWRDELAGRLVRSRNAHCLCAGLQCLPLPFGARSSAKQGLLGHGLRSRHRRARSSHDPRTG